MSKLYFVLPDVSLTREILAELTSNDVPLDGIGMVANDETDLEDLPRREVPGSVFGTWLSDLVGVLLPQDQADRFEAAIDAGDVLMIVEVPEDRRGEIKKLVTDRHPQAFFGGEDEMVPPAV